MTTTMITRNKEKLPLGLQIGIYMISFTVYSTAAITPAMGALMAKFSDAPAWVVSLIGTLPSLTVILGALIAGAVVGKRLSYKAVAIISMIIFGGFGILPAWVSPNLEIVLVWRALAGFGNGLMFPLAAAAILRYVQNPELRSSYLGRNQALGSGGAIVLTLLGGWLAGIDAMDTFYAFLVTFLALILVLIFFKEPPTLDEVIAKNPEYQEQGNAKRVKLAPLCWAFLIMFTCYSIIQTPVLMTLAPRMTAAAGGVDQSAVAGVVISMFTLGNCLIALFVDKIVKLLGRFSALLYWVLGAIGIFIIFMATNNLMFGLGSFITGLGLGVAVMTQLECSQISTPAAMAWVASLSMIATNLGSFLGSFWLGILQGIFGSNFNSIPLTSAIGFLLMGIIWTLFDLRNKAWNKKHEVSA